jgi:hypothetical protein
LVFVRDFQLVPIIDMQSDELFRHRIPRDGHLPGRITRHAKVVEGTAKRELLGKAVDHFDYTVLSIWSKVGNSAFCQRPPEAYACFMISSFLQPDRISS